MFYQSLAAPVAALLLAAQIEPAARAAVEPAPVATADAACCTVPARTPIDIEILDTVNSKANATRDSFAFRLAEPLAIDGRIVVPAGTPGVGEVVHAARARAGGKAGELILAARYLDLNGTRIPLRSMRYGRSQGVDNSGAVNAGAMVAVATIPVAGFIGYMISGGEVNIPAGTRATAQTSAEIVLAPIE